MFLQNVVIINFFIKLFLHKKKHFEEKRDVLLLKSECNFMQINSEKCNKLIIKDYR